MPTFRFIKILGILVFLLSLAILGALLSQGKKKSPNSTVVTSQASAQIIIDVGQSIGPANKPLQGFLTGVGHKPEDQLDQARVSALQPRSWRIPDWVYYDKIKAFNPKITFILGEQYANNNGGWGKARPWENWDDWERFVKETIQFSKTQNKPIDYWDVWGEPDLGGGTPWKGSYSDLLELFGRTIKTIRSVDPNTQVVGPSVSEFKPRFQEGDRTVVGLDTFLSDLNERFDVLPDAISWHELGSLPEGVPTNAQTLRTFLSQTFPDYHPELHVNEFTSEPEHLIPGWTVGWLYYLEQAKLDVVSRGCWSFREAGKKPWSDCWAGLNGLLSEDNTTPHPIYWVHKWYGEMSGEKLSTSTSDTQTIALAAQDTTTEKISLLVGRFVSRTTTRNGSQDVRLVIQNYPFNTTQARIEIRRIPNDRVFSPSPTEPAVTANNVVVVNNKQIELSLPAFQDGDAYRIIIKPVRAQ